MQFSPTEAPGRYHLAVAEEQNASNGMGSQKTRVRPIKPHDHRAGYHDYMIDRYCLPANPWASAAGRSTSQGIPPRSLGAARPDIESPNWII